MDAGSAPALSIKAEDMLDNENSGQQLHEERARKGSWKWIRMSHRILK
jgi:hypothetical protein